MAPKRGNTKGAMLSTRHMPEKARPTANAGAHDPTHGADLYALLGVSPDAEAEELKLAYRQKALAEHPDKGGDQDKFDAIVHAYERLQDPQRREEYDEQRLEAAYAVPVEGRPEGCASGEKVAHKKTAPTVGSKRQKDWHKQADEWAGERSAAAVVASVRLALTDAVGPQLSQASSKETQEAETEALFKKLSEFKSAGARKQWMDGLTGKQKQALKARAKLHEAQEMQKAKKWLAK